MLQYPVHRTEQSARNTKSHVEMECFKNILKDWKIMELGEFTELLIPS